MVLLCVLCLLVVRYAVAIPHIQSQRSAPPSKGDPKRVYLIHADELRYDRWQNNDAQVLVGSVQFEHDGAKLFCDSANFFESSNSFEAWGHVRMVQGDTLSLTSKQGYYDGNQQLMEAKDSVVLRHRKTVLYTDELYYDRIWNQGYFQNGGRLVDEGTTLTSDWGEYHTDSKMAIFYYDVRMVDKQFLLTTDSLYYDTQVKRAHIVGPSDITSGKSHIYSELGYYNTVTEEAELLNRSRLDNEGRVLVGDSLWHDGKTGISEAFVNVIFTDTVNKSILQCDYGHYEDSIGYAVCTDKALAIDYSQRDSLFVHGDTIKVFTYNINTDSVYRVMHAYNKVRAYRIDIQAVCDSLVYSSLDSCMTLYHDPITWNMNQQLVGDKIEVFMKDSVIDHAHVIDNAFSIEQLPKDKCYNQVSSKEMFAFFTEGHIHEAQAKDNVLTIYYPEDKADSSYVGLVYMETSELRIMMDEQGKMSRIWAPKSEGTMYPMSQIPPDKRYLNGFAWYDYVRPISKEDVFVWRGKKSSGSDQNADEANNKGRQKDTVKQSVEPVAESEPVEEVESLDESEPVEEVESVDETKPMEEVQPVDETKTVEEVKTADETGPEDASQSEEHEETTPVQS